MYSILTFAKCVIINAEIYYTSFIIPNPWELSMFSGERKMFDEIR